MVFEVAVNRVRILGFPGAFELPHTYHPASMVFGVTVRCVRILGQNVPKTGGIYLTISDRSRGRLQGTQDTNLCVGFDFVVPLSGFGILVY